MDAAGQGHPGDDGGAYLGGGVFLALFGNLFLEQAAQLLRHLPGVAETVTSWVNARLGTQLQGGRHPRLHSARLILATINTILSAVVFLLLGMPSWLALGVWTGVVTQFVPTIGTYISIALPALVGMASPQPWMGIAALAWAILYQQVENLTLEPWISARSVDLHPAVSFTTVLLDAALSIPVTAMLCSLIDTYAATRPEPAPATVR